MAGDEDAYHALCAYTLGLRDPRFIHQHVVDAWLAQHATADVKPIGITFALAGLYLMLEKGFTGRQVQRAHMQMAREKHAWPQFALPVTRGAMTATDVMVAAPGPARDAAIEAWCASVWAAYAGNREIVAALLKEHGIA